MYQKTTACLRTDSEEEVVWKNQIITSVIICLTEDKQSDKDLKKNMINQFYCYFPPMFFIVSSS